jgi:CDP-diacylglycerol--glycerol-3-phosphate 3-phosphatidyltransferase
MISITLATWFTLIRLALSPLVLPFLLVYFLPFNDLLLNFIVAIIFTFLALTDFFDGYLARKYSQVTLFGKILDPIADKFLVYSTLIALLVIDKIYFYWVVLLIGREFFVMGLRLIAAEYGFSVPVSQQGKNKTAIQMILLIFLIINPYQKLGFSGAPWIFSIEHILLFFTLFLALSSAFSYYQSFIRMLRRIE